MSYETENHLPKGVSIRQAVEFARLLGYQPNGTYAHLGMPKTLSLVHFEDRDYQSWNVIELSISAKDGRVAVGTRTRIGRSPYDFQKQNQTVREFRRRFGGATWKDGGDGSGYEPGPPIPPAASGCYLAARRLEANLSRLNIYLTQYPTPDVHQSMLAAQQIWPEMKQYHPEVFSRNVLIPYIVATMEDFLKSMYIALLRYTANKASIMKGVRLSGEQLTLISDGKLSVEEAVAENKSFQNLRLVGRNFAEVDRKLDILAPLRKPIRRRTSLFDHLERLVEQRHALIHGMDLDLALDTKKVRTLVAHVENGMGKVYAEVIRHHGWKKVMSHYQ